MSYIGYDWTEPHRVEAARRHWAPWVVDCPLTRRPYLWKEQVFGLFRERGIEPPRLYGYGFAHSNCGGACVRAGQAQWSLLLRVNRARYLEWEAEENLSRELLGKNVSILTEQVRGIRRPLPLAAFRKRLGQPAEPVRRRRLGRVRMRHARHPPRAGRRMTRTLRAVTSGSPLPLPVLTSPEPRRVPRHHRNPHQGKPPSWPTSPSPPSAAT